MYEGYGQIVGENILSVNGFEGACYRFVTFFALCRMPAPARGPSERVLPTPARLYPIIGSGVPIDLRHAKNMQRPVVQPQRELLTITGETYRPNHDFVIMRIEPFACSYIPGVEIAIVTAGKVYISIE